MWRVDRVNSFTLMIMGQGCVLGQGHELVEKDGIMLRRALGQDDMDHGLGLGQSRTPGRFHLALGMPRTPAGRSGHRPRQRSMKAAMARSTWYGVP